MLTLYSVFAALADADGIGVALVFVSSDADGVGEPPGCSGAGWSVLTEGALDVGFTVAVCLGVALFDGDGSLLSPLS